MDGRVESTYIGNLGQERLIGIIISKGNIRWELPFVILASPMVK